VHPEDRQISAEQKQRIAAREEAPATSEYRWKTKSGEYRWFSDTRTLVCDAQGQPEALVGISRDITDRKLAEEALRRSEEQYRSIFNRMTEGFALHEILCDPGGKVLDYRFLDINPAFERLSGLKRAQVIGHLRSEVVPDQDPYWLELYGQVALTGEPWHVVHYIAALQRHFEIFAYSPAPGQFAVLFLDITERQKAEDSLKESEARLKTVVENTPDVVMQVDQQGTITFINHVLPGQQADWVIGTDIFRWTPEAQRPVMRKALETILQSGERWEFEFSVPTPSGRMQTYMLRGMPVIVGGEISSALFTAVDISAYKQAEQALKESEAKWRRLFDLLPVGVSVVDANRRVVEANLALGQILDMPRDNILQGVYQKRNYYRSDGSPMTVDEFPSTRAIREQTPILDVEIGIEKEDGQSLWTNVSATPFFPGPEIIVVTTDITQRKHIETALLQALKGKDILVSEFLHRVKNNLAIVESLLYLEEDSLQDEHSREVFASTRARLKSMLAVYDQLYGRGEITEINLSQYVKDLVDGLSKSYLPQSGGVVIETQVAEIQMEIKRAVTIGLILNELITNALKYAFPSAKAVRAKPGVIRVALTLAEDQVQLIVSDNGVGVTAQPSPSGGKGLDLVGMLARQLDGSLSIDSSAGFTAKVQFGLSS
jgi:PAS domain S-box-containing protein